MGSAHKNKRKKKRAKERPTQTPIATGAPCQEHLAPQSVMREKAETWLVKDYSLNTSPENEGSKLTLDALLRAKYEALSLGTYRLYIFGEIRYSDIFDNEPHTTKWCLYVFNKAPFVELQEPTWELASCPEFNNMD